MIAKALNRKLFVISALLLSGVLIYSNTFYGSFHFDDTTSIVKNPAIRNILDLPAIWNFSPTRFIAYLSVALNYHFSGLNAFSYHLFNLVIHLSSAVLVWWFMLLIFSAPAMNGKRIAKHADLLAFFGALVFMAHPVQTQGVTYIIQRITSSATLFYLLSLCLYVKSRLLQQRRMLPAVSRTFYCGSLIAALMAIFTKEITVTLPLTALLFEICFLRTKRKIDWKYSVPLFAIASIIPITMLLTRSLNLIPAPCISPRQYLFTQFRVIVTYIRLLFIPINQNLDYDYHIVKSLLELPALASLILLISILTAAVKIYPEYRLPSFGIFWFFLTLSVESGIVPIKDVIFEHRLYLPMAGFSLFLVSAVYYVFENKAARTMVMALVIIASCYAVLSYRRNLVWKDDLALWSDTVRKSPGKARPYFNRGIAYGRQGNFSKAIPDINKAIEINDNFAKALKNRGPEYLMQGSLSKAIRDFNLALDEINAHYVEAYNYRGYAYYSQGNLAQAISDYTKVIEIDPDFADAYEGRAYAYFDKKEYGKAREDAHNAESLGYEPDKKDLEFLDKLKRVSGGDK